MSNVILRNVRKTYPGGFEAIKGVNFEIGDGQFCVLVGPSGCGKSHLGAALGYALVENGYRVLFVPFAGGKPQKLARAAASFGSAQPAIDGDKQSGWAVGGGQGRAHAAVFVLEKPSA